MAKNIFQPMDIIQNAEIVCLDPPTFPEELNIVYDENGEPIVVPYGETPETIIPSLDEVRKEASALLVKAEEEAAAIIKKAQEEATVLIETAQKTAEEKIEAITADIEKNRAQFEDEHNAVIAKAQAEAEKMLEIAQSQVETLHNKTKELATKEGYDEGYQKGYEEVQRLVERLHTIINRVIDKRNDILGEVETQVVELALLMVRKVVKVIADNQKSVVINNIIQALGKLRGRSDITIRVNMQDLDLVSQQSERFITLIENRGDVHIIEDSSIDIGGCVVETDFGEIDARISSQLSEIENRIRDLMPITMKPLTINDDF